ncbi:hypothetical protein GCM10010464_09560 [Pseudonocardia yunnanensis]|uniref:Uncharacterized protein n=1 Tax=Pseudonocardia yunnanensis TaxID=58107 RepID=A0ABW4EXZ1_9PSEU
MDEAEHRNDVRHDLVDDVFGRVTIAVDVGGGLVTVQGESLPEVTVERRSGVPLLGYIPIGTRDPAALTLRVAGTRQELNPAKAGLSRRSYRVRARIDSVDLLLTPNSPTTARLVRGRSYKPERELGVYERLDDGSVAARWHQDVAVLGVVAPAARPEPAEAAVGYALATAFGTGARFFLFAMFAGLGENAPW